MGLIQYSQAVMEKIQKPIYENIQLHTLMQSVVCSETQNANKPFASIAGNMLFRIFYN